MRLLNIESSPRGSRSASITVTSAFIEAYRQTCPWVMVDTLNVWEEMLPDFDQEAIGAKYKGVNKEPMDQAETAVWDKIQELAARFRQADRIVLGVPMWNFAYPYVLVSNAGETVRAPLESVPISEVQRLFELNTLGALRVAQGVLPAMRERGAGRLVFVSSIQGRLVLPLIGPYAASKWALEALAETLAIETGHFGIKVSIVQPGVVSSGGAERANVFLKENDPYTPLLEALDVLRGESVTPLEVAATVADTIEHPKPPLRVPVGAPATRVLQARKEAPDSKPFLTAEIDW
ncbi:SDR family NAD(P)-dependent oxidoreductase [Dactylosporangium darangshiense]|uniref:Uncharacterized protein n=1 Tax=Dactylosporangium darangshiense TaxID=579108 RepID=A0ABP8DIC9_9ACTN